MEIHTKKEADTNPMYGKPPEARTVEELVHFGVVNLDKPAGPTSHQVSDFVQKILNIRKAGHSGSLDPQVTGILPVALEHATRLSHILLKGGKGYTGIMHIHKEVEKARIQEVLQKFIGKITQMPPVRSAVKRQWRERTVYSLIVHEIEENDILFSVDCEAGTYIRKLCHDVGKALGTGAHMTELRRTRVTSFTEEGAVTLQDLQDALMLWKEEGNEKFIRHCIKPAERMAEHLPKMWVFDSTVESLCHGRDLAIPGISKINPFQKDQTIAIMTLKDELIALGTSFVSSDDILNNEKGIAAKTKKVFMQAGTYAISKEVAISKEAIKR